MGTTQAMRDFRYRPRVASTTPSTGTCTMCTGWKPFSSASPSHHDVIRGGGAEENLHPRASRRFRRCQSPRAPRLLRWLLPTATAGCGRRPTTARRPGQCAQYLIRLVCFPFRVPAPNAPAPSYPRSGNKILKISLDLPRWLITLDASALRFLSTQLLTISFLHQVLLSVTARCGF
jgi:hypothetical protein